MSTRFVLASALAASIVLCWGNALVGVFVALFDLGVPDRDQHLAAAGSLLAHAALMPLAFLVRWAFDSPWWIPVVALVGSASLVVLAWAQHRDASFAEAADAPADHPVWEGAVLALVPGSWLLLGLTAAAVVSLLLRARSRLAPR